MITTKISTIVVPAWGWHHEDKSGDHRLRVSLERYGQLAPLVVREVNSHFEVIDGRRRHALLQDMNVQDVWVVNKGPLTESEAIQVALSLELGAEVDYIRLAQQVLTVEERSLGNFTPFTEERLAYFRQLCKFDWKQYETLVQQHFFEAAEEHEVYTPEPVAPPPVTPVVTPPPVIAAPRAPVAAPRRDGASARLSAALTFDHTPSSRISEPVARPMATVSEADIWALPPAPAVIPEPPRGSGIQFFGIDPVAHTWKPSEPPCLDGITEVSVNVETTGLKWYAGDRPISITVGTLDGQLKQFLPFGFAGGNLDEDTVKRWAQRELRGKKITNANTRFDVHMLREWGVDLEEQGCEFSDVMHYAALLDEYRMEFALDVLVKDFLNVTAPARVDESRMATYHAGDVATRAEFQVDAVAQLRATMWPLLDAESLQKVRAVEDEVIPVVCEMEKNAAHVDRLGLKRMVEQSGEILNRCLWEVARDLGFDMNPDKNEDWQRLFDHYKIPVTSFTAPSTRFPQGQPSFGDAYLSTVEHPVVQLARRAGKIASLRSKFLLAYDEVVGDDCKLRFALHQLRGDEYGTVRGRFSMSGGGRRQPRFGANLQQVFRVNSQREAFGYAHNDPSHDHEIFLVRSLFIPEQGTYLSADAQSIEYRLAAHFANSDPLIAAYAQDFQQLVERRLTDKWVDFHAVVGDVIRPYKDLSRNIIKNANFCLVYGGGVDTAARTMGLPRDETVQIVDVWRRMFP